MHKALLVLVLVLSPFCRAGFAQDDFVEGQAAPETVSIGRLDKPPVLDGELDDWPTDTTSVVLGSAQSGLRRHFNWTGTRDSSAAIRLAWDDQFFYLAADVADDKPVQVTDDKEIYQGDALELFFNRSPRQYQVDGFSQIAIAPPLKPGESLHVVGAQKPFEGVEGTAKTYPGGYTLECRIPWKNLAGFTPAVGESLGLQMMLDDRDAKGRKSQQIWYPSAVTFAQPTHMNVVRLAYRGDTARPRLAAGPLTWCVADQKKMNVSLVADVAGGSRAAISLISSPHKPTPLAQAEPLLTLPLEAVGPRLKIAQGTLPSLESLDGLCTFGVTITDKEARVLATGTFEAQMSAGPFARVRELAARLPKRLEALAQNPSVDPLVRHGLAAWLQRCKAFIANDASPESASRRLLDQLVEEMNALDAAVTRCEGGANPYDTLTGSFVEAYTSPLTGAPRGLALLVPETYDPKAGDRWPLIFLLHGIFADERQLSAMAGRLRGLGAIVCQAPSYRQFDWGGISAAESWTGLAAVLKQYRVDPDRMYLIGHANGGRGAWQLAEARPDLWAACAPLLSGADTGPKWDALRLYPQFFAQANDFRLTYGLYRAAEPPLPFGSALEKKLLEQASLASRVENVVGLPLRHSYGEENPATAAERLAMFDRFAQLDTPLSTQEVPGAAHGAQPEEWQSPEFFQWLLSHRRPPAPDRVCFTANGLRNNAAWWVRVDQLDTPADCGRIEARREGEKIAVTTSGLRAFTLSPQAKSGQPLEMTINQQSMIKVTTNEHETSSFVRGADGQWRQGGLEGSGKKHGLSGPIDDFQFDRFMVVYGTQGDAQANALLVKKGKRMADWGLGAVFDCKADREVTDEDIQRAHLILVGTPKENSVLARMADRLPVQWSDDGFSLGPVQVSGAGAGVCFVQPDPLAPERYVVVVSAHDEEGYGVWEARGPSDDYLLGYGKTVEKKATFTLAGHGCFDNGWQWTKDECVTP